MRKIILLVFLCFFLFLVQNSPSLANFFSMTHNPLFGGGSDLQETSSEDIPLRDDAYNLIQKRIREARELINEGRKLIKKGEKKNKESLVIKGKIKKEIGERQLERLQEQAKNKQEEDKSNDW